MADVRVGTPRFSQRRYRNRRWPCPRPSDFSILVVYARDDIFLQLSGRLSVEGSRAFDDCVVAAIEQDPRRLVVDCSGLEMLESAGTGCFLRAELRTVDAGVGLVLEALCPSVQQVLRDAAVYDHFMVR